MAHMWTKSAAGWEARKLDPKLYDLDSLSIAQAGESIAGAAARRVPGGFLPPWGEPGLGSWRLPRRGDPGQRPHPAGRIVGALRPR